VLDIHYAANLFVNKVDTAGSILNHPTAMKEAYRLGRELVLSTAPPLEEPTDVELT